MATFFFDVETNGLVRGDYDGQPKYRLAVLENDGDLILHIETDGHKTDLHLSGQQAVDFVAACNDIGDRMKIVWKQNKS